MNQREWHSFLGGLLIHVAATCAGFLIGFGLTHVRVSVAKVGRLEERVSFLEKSVQYKLIPGPAAYVHVVDPPASSPPAPVIDPAADSYNPLRDPTLEPLTTDH